MQFGRATILAGTASLRTSGALDHTAAARDSNAGGWCVWVRRAQVHISCWRRRSIHGVPGRAVRLPDGDVTANSEAGASGRPYRQNGTRGSNDPQAIAREDPQRDGDWCADEGRVVAQGHAHPEVIARRYVSVKARAACSGAPRRRSRVGWSPARDRLSAWCRVWPWRPKTPRSHVHPELFFRLKVSFASSDRVFSQFWVGRPPAPQLSLSVRCFLQPAVLARRLLRLVCWKFSLSSPQRC